MMIVIIQELINEVTGKQVLTWARRIEAQRAPKC